MTHPGDHFLCCIDVTMFYHIESGKTIFARSRKPRSLIGNGEIVFWRKQAIENLRNTILQVRQTNKNSKPCFLWFRKGSNRPGLQALRALYEKEISKMENGLILSYSIVHVVQSPSKLCPKQRDTFVNREKNLQKQTASYIFVTDRLLN
jgi:hypothetical protein